MVLCVTPRKERFWCNRMNAINSSGRRTRNPEGIHWNSQMPFTTAPIAWQVGKLETCSIHDGKREFSSYISAMDSYQIRHQLPVEFFNHQLLSVDAEDECALLAFMEEWGLPFSPLRSADKPLFDFMLNEVITDKALRRQMKQGIRESDAAFKKIPMPFDEKIPISRNEATSTLLMLQSIVESIHASVLNGSPLSHEALAYVDLGATNARVLLNRNSNPVFMRLLSWQTLTAAICNQIIETVADEKAQWYECENCGLVFKRRQSRWRKPDNDSICCCETCKDHFQYVHRKKGGRDNGASCKR